MNTTAQHSLTVSPHPFAVARDRHVMAVPHGLRLREMLELAGVGGLPEENLRVILDDWVIPSALWAGRPMEGTIIIVNVVPSGGGGNGGKNPLRLIATLALMAVANVYGGVLGSTLGFSTNAIVAGSTATWASTMGGLIITAAGGLLINALIPPTTTPLTNDASTDTRYSISGSSNQMTPWQSVPRVYGKIRMFPRTIGQYTVSEGEDQYLYILFDFGYGKLQLSEFQIGEDELSNYEDVNYHVHDHAQTGEETDDAFTLYTDLVIQDDYSLEVTKSDDDGNPNPQTVTTKEDADAIGLDINFPAGLYRYDESEMVSYTVELLVQYRKRGEENWMAVPRTEAAKSGGTVTESDISSGSRYITYLTDYEPDGLITITLGAEIGTPTGSSLSSITYTVYSRDKDATVWVYQNRITLSGGATGTVTVSPNSGKQCEIMIENSDIVQTGSSESGLWDGANSGEWGFNFYNQDEWIGSKAVMSVSFAYNYYDVGAGELVITDKSMSPFTHSIRWDTGDAAQYEIRVERITNDHEDNQNYADKSYISAVRTIRLTSPIDFEVPHTVVEMRVKATDQISGSLSEFSALTESLVSTYDPATQTWTENVSTRNPAWHFLDVLIGTAARKPVPESRIDLTGIVAWAAACDETEPENDNYPAEEVQESPEPYFRHDRIFEGGTRQQALSDIAAAGRARLVFRDGQFSVVRDVHQSVIRQLFTPRNSWGFTAKKSFSAPIHAIKVSYLDEENDYQASELVVYDDGYDAENATEFFDLELPGVTRAGQAWRDARYHLAVLSLRPETFELNVDVENLVVTAGDLVAVAHDVPLLGGTPSRVKAVTLNTQGAVDTVILDTRVTINPGFSMMARLSSGGVVTHALGNDTVETNTLTLPLPAMGETAPGVGDLVVVGPTERVTARMLVKEIIPGEWPTATLILVDEAPGVYTADQGLIPDYDPQIVKRKVLVPPPVLQLTIGILADYSNQTQVTYKAVVSWRLPTGATAATHAVYLKTQRGTWNQLGVTTTTRYEIPGVHYNDTLTVKVIARNADGNGCGLHASPTATVTVTNPPPPDVAELRANISLDGSTAFLSWPPVSWGYTSHYEIRWSPLSAGSMWEAAQTVIDNVAHPTMTVVVNVAVGTWMIKAVDFDGQESAHAATRAMVQSSLMNINLVASLSDPDTWAVMGNWSRLGNVVLVGAVTTVWDGVMDGTAVEDGILHLVQENGAYVAQGFYDFSDPVDLGVSQACWLRYSGEWGVVDESVVGQWELIGNRYLLGAPGDDWRFTVLVATTADDPGSISAAWNGWMEVTPGLVEARGFKFRLRLESGHAYLTPQIAAITVMVDMPDRVDQGEDISCPTTGMTVNFTSPFHVVPLVLVSGQDMAAGENVRVNNKTTSGFAIQFRNSSGSGVARYFDWQARGY